MEKNTEKNISGLLVAGLLVLLIFLADLSSRINANGDSPLPPDGTVIMTMTDVEAPHPAAEAISTSGSQPVILTYSGIITMYAGNAVMLDNSHGYLIDENTAIDGNIHTGCHADIIYMQTEAGLKIISIVCTGSVSDPTSALKDLPALDL